MSRYNVTVDMTTKQTVTYFVEAQSEQEAKEKVIDGDYIDYDTQSFYEEIEYDWESAEFVIEIEEKQKTLMSL